MKERIDKIFDVLYEHIGLFFYVLLWIILVGFFWVKLSPGDAFGYSVLTFYLVLPIASLAVGIYYGMKKTRFRYAIPVLCGLFEMFGGFFTFQFKNMISNGRWNSWNTPDLQMSLYGIIPALVGLIIGILLHMFIKKLRKRKK